MAQKIAGKLAIFVIPARSKMPTAMVERNALLHTATTGSVRSSLPARWDNSLSGMLITVPIRSPIHSDGRRTSSTCGDSAVCIWAYSF